MRRHRDISFTSTLAIALAVAWPSGHAQETRIDPAQAEELMEVERALGGASSSRDAAEAKAKAAARAVLRLREELVAAGDRAAALETAVSENQSHIEGLVAARAVSEALLATRREQLVESLAALQRLDLEPPPALLVKPQDALAAARGAMLLGTLVPELKSVADDLSEQIKSLEDLTRTITSQREQLTQDVAALNVEQRRIDELLVAKREEELISSTDAKRAADKYAELAGRARSLRDLLGGLEEDVPTFAALRPGDDAETAPPAFSTLRGTLRSPATGRIIQRFGSDDGSGSPSQGVSLRARAGGQVVSPADAEIVFAGPFRSYGNVLIITPGDNYLIVIAGLAEIYAGPGQQLLAGEPIGRLPTSANAANGGQNGRPEAGRGAGNTPVLYIEMRKDGKPVDPAPWIRFQGRPA
ncbi:MAG: peptidoglycan DD-metalloendopeptidase family protein [Alphaproteobacteria bacterium]|nr:peptidoglycan DD-metalloendopeptidase family protein [Alphaproteobacteria bacterium]